MRCFKVLSASLPAPDARMLLDLVASALHLGRQAVPTVSLEATWAGHLAQRGDGAFELRQRRRIFLRDDEIDLVREAGHRLVEADQVFRRRQPAQRVAHFGQPVLDTGQRAAVDAGLAAFRDALVQALDLPSRWRRWRAAAWRR